MGELTVQGKKNRPPKGRPVSLKLLQLANLDVRDDVAEYVADGWAKQGQDDDDYDGHQDQDQGIFHETLALVIPKREHG